MRLFLNPLIWLRRIRHRCGYGVHSPFAFNFLTQVVYERGTYYAYDRLDALYPSWYRTFGLRPLQVSRLLFRIVNYVHPRTAFMVDASEIDGKYMREASKNTHFIDNSSVEAVDFIFLSHPVDGVLWNAVHEGTALVLYPLRAHLEWWSMVQRDARTRVTFDLYDVGIAFFNPKLNKQNYIVNF